MMSPCLLLLLCAAALAHDPAVSPQYKLTVHHLRADDLPQKDVISKSDAYVKVYNNGKPLGQTAHRNNRCSPWWKEKFECLVQDKIELKLEIYDRDEWSRDDRIGTCWTNVTIESQTKTCVPECRECKLKPRGRLLYDYTLEFKK